MSESNKPTLKDIAMAANVSAMAVSLALRDSPKISLGTRKRIQILARKLHYRPNAFAVTLRHSKRPETQAHHATLALIVGHKGKNPVNSLRPHFQHAVAGVVKRAQSQGYAIEHIWRYSPGFSANRIHSILKAYNVPGIIFCSIHENEMGFPLDSYACAYLAASPAGSKLPHVSFDPYQNTIDLLKRLHGRPNIGLAVWPAYHQHNEGRVVAAFEHMRQRLGLPGKIPVCIHQPSGTDHKSEILAILRWIRKYDVKTLISPSAHLERWLRDAGVDIPGELSFINLELQNPDSTTPGMLPPWGLIGAAAADLVIAQIHRGEHGESDNPKTIHLTTQWHNPP